MTLPSALQRALSSTSDLLMWIVLVVVVGRLASRMFDHAAPAPVDEQPIACRPARRRTGRAASLDAVSAPPAVKGE